MMLSENIGKFIVIEGLDGSGKSTQAKMLAERIEKSGKPCLATRQPSDGQVGQMARAATKSGFPLDNEAVALLFAADRVQHFHDEIAPALAAGKYVVCDRYYYSNLAYQGVDEAAFRRVTAYNQWIMTHGRPDIVIFLDVPPEACMERIQRRHEEISIYESLALLQAQRERFLYAFSQSKGGENILTVNADGKDVDTVSDLVWDKLLARQ